MRDGFRLLPTTCCNVVNSSRSEFLSSCHIGARHASGFLGTAATRLAARCWFSGFIGARNRHEQKDQCLPVTDFVRSDLMFHDFSDGFIDHGCHGSLNSVGLGLKTSHCVWPPEEPPEACGCMRSQPSCALAGSGGISASPVVLVTLSSAQSVMLER